MVQKVEKGRNRNNSWDANFRAKSKSHCLDSLLVLTWEALLLEAKTLSHTPESKDVEGNYRFSTVSNFYLFLY